MCMCGAAGMYIIICTRRSRSRHILYIAVYCRHSPFQLACIGERPGECITFVYVCVCVCERAHVTSWFIDTTMSMVIKVEKRGADVPRVRRQRRSCVSSSSSSHYTSVCIYCAAAMVFKHFLYYITRQSTLYCSIFRVGRTANVVWPKVSKYNI